jgi:hypothetical protein
MDEKPKSRFVPIKDAEGKINGIMDRTTAEFFASNSPNPTQASLDAVLGRTTSVSVVAMTNPRRVFIETRDPVDVAEFRRCFAIHDDRESYGHAMCFGDVQLELYEGDKVLVAFEYFFRGFMRWDAWKGDAWFCEPKRLVDWMAARGLSVSSLFS